MIETYFQTYETVPYLLLDVTLIQPQFPTIILKIIDDEKIDVIETFPSHLFKYI